MSLVSIAGESDEEFARRLQAQEMGLAPELAGRIRNIDAETPLMQENGGRGGITIRTGADGNPTVINARLNEIATARITVIALVVVNIPQVIAAIIVLSIYWNDDSVCSVDSRNKWDWWAALSALRMFVYTSIVLFMHVFRHWLEQSQNNNVLVQVSHFRNLVDAIGLIWFLVGNVWVFGEDNNCSNPQASPTYNLCMAMLIINYIQICLPCIIALCMIPVFCFCMPCLIRVLARLQNQNAPKGATDAIINLMPITIITEELVRDDKTCPVCLNDMVVGEEARLLTCRHLFHKQCVDEWLRVNASCPTCRMSIINVPASDDTEGGGSMGDSNIAVSGGGSGTNEIQHVGENADEGFGSSGIMLHRPTHGLFSRNTGGERYMSVSDGNGTSTAGRSSGRGERASFS